MNKVVFERIVVIFLLLVLLGITFCYSVSNNNEYMEDFYEGDTQLYSETELEYGQVSRVSSWFNMAIVIFQNISVLVCIFVLILFVCPYIISKVKKESEEVITKKKNNMITAIIVGALFLILGILLNQIRTFKPIIYIYPEKETEVNVTLEKEELLDCTYPKYENGWRVKAYPNGDLVDLKTGRKLYSLYWEGGRFKLPDYKEGFVIKGEDSAKFLEEKLEILGLNYKETEEFIVYWLPKMEKNKYNYIKFVPQNEIDEQMPLNIEPKPDTTIRVYMQFKGLKNPINIKEQELEKVERSGYTVVEWGGSEI